MPIRRLPDDLINKIAAGEVIERPASALKELLENALDAGATDVEILLEEAGKRLLYIADNGAGMSPEEMRMALERHATSKIASMDDLLSVASYGFRGEALPSIASVSRMQLVSRREEDLGGGLLVVEAGQIGEEREVGAPRGTRLEVRDLFFNTPARLKFLKTTATELGHCIDVAGRLVLLRPDVRLTLRHQGQTLLNLPPTDDLAGRIAAVVGQAVYRHLFPVRWSDATGAVVTGMASSPAAQRRTAASALYLYVNRRPVKDRTIHSAVMAAYGTLVERGSFPVAVLNLDVPPEQVDVNVHPAKAEVRFSDPSAIFRVVRHALEAMLDAVPWASTTPDGDHEGTLSPDDAALRDAVRRSLDNARRDAPEHPRAGQHTPWRSAAEAPRRAATQYSLPLKPTPERFEQCMEGTTKPSPAAATGEATNDPSAPGPERRLRLKDLEQERRELALLPGGRYSSLAVIGILDRTYILAESPRGLVIIDQHAAHERVLFVRMRADLGRRAIATEPLLIPLTIDLPPSLVALAEGQTDLLRATGFEVRPMGPSTLALLATPSRLPKGVDPGTILASVLEELAHNGAQASQEEAVDLVVATAACHAAVRAHDPLTHREAEALLAQMDETSRSGYCPHGRPVVVELSFAALKRLFGRT